MKDASTIPEVVSHFDLHRDSFVINKTYQREEAWTLRDKQCFIDSLIRNLDTPKIYVWKVSDKRFEIVDGQQRLVSILGFYDNKFALSGEFSKKNLDGKKYKDLDYKLQKEFDNRKISTCYLQDYDDKDIRALFRRLQRGRALNISERLNAFPGDITLLMRSYAKHDFFQKSCTLPGKRYRYYQVAARLMLIEKEGIKDIKPGNLEYFFDQNKPLTGRSNAGVRITKVLNYLFKYFPDKTPELHTEVWIITAYLFVSDLLKNYVLENKEKEIANFYKNYWSETARAMKSRSGASETLEFAFLLSGTPSSTTGGSNVKRRLELIKTSFLKAHSDLILKDPRREFTHYEKVVIFRKNEEAHGGKAICEDCGKKVSWKEYEGDHIYPYSRGGRTTIENGQVLCRRCNRRKRDRIKG